MEANGTKTRKLHVRHHGMDLPMPVPKRRGVYVGIGAPVVWNGLRGTRATVVGGDQSKVEIVTLTSGYWNAEDARRLSLPWGDLYATLGTPFSPEAVPGLHVLALELLRDSKDGARRYDWCREGIIAAVRDGVALIASESGRVFQTPLDQCHACEVRGFTPEALAEAAEYRRLMQPEREAVRA